MRLLIVEDDENKRTQVSRFIVERFPLAIIRLEKSFQSGLRAILSERFNLIIMDMSLPTFDITNEEDGGRPQVYAGRELLRQMDRREITIPVVVVTQFETFGEGRSSLTLQQLNSLLRNAHSSTYVGAIYYHAAYEDWKEELAATIQSFAAGDSTNDNDPNSRG